MMVPTPCRRLFSRTHRNSSHIIPCIFLIMRRQRQTWKPKMEDKSSEVETKNQDSYLN